MIQVLVFLLLRAALVHSNFRDPFSWDDSCSPNDPALKIRFLSVSGDPIEFSEDQPIMASLNSVIKHDIGTDITAIVEIKKKETFFFVDIPCIGGFGSCSFNLCDLVTDESGPLCSVLQQMGKECSCPLEIGEYHLEEYTFEVDPSIIPEPIRTFGNGQYVMKTTLTDGDGYTVFCLFTEASVKFDDEQQISISFNRTF